MAVEEECDCPVCPEERVEWIYTYGDMVTLLLAFFILLFATAKTEEEKLVAVSAAFRGGPPASPYLFEGMPTFMESVQSELQKSEISDEINVTVDDRGITVSFSDTAFFERSSAKLTKKAEELIQKFARILYSIPNSVIIEGHTDNDPVTPGGAYPSNWELSAARAGAVTTKLEKLGINEKRLEIAAFGSTRPKTGNNSEKQKAANRRIDILIKPDFL